MSYRLNCYYPGIKPNVVNIAIDPNLLIFNLAKEVQHELSEIGVTLSRADLQLFKTDLSLAPKEDLPSRALQWLHEQNANDRLDNVDQIVQIFPQAPSASHVNIIVSDTDTWELRDSLDDPLYFQNKKLHEDLVERIKSINLNNSPSETVASAAKIRGLFEDANTHHIHTGRPGGAPPAIFNPALATLQHCLDHLDEIDVDRRDIDRAARYLNHAIQFYPDEADRKRELKTLLEKVLGSGSWNTTLDWADEIRPECCWWHNDFSSILLELRNIVGIGGNPIVEALVDYTKIITSDKYKGIWDFCNFPAVLIGIAENRIEISIAVWIGDVHVSKLLTLDVTSGFLASDNIIRVARVFKALSACQKDLALYYNEITQRNIPRFSSLFPKPTLVDSSGELPALTYKHFMSRDGQPAPGLLGLGDTTTVMYIAALDKYDKEVIVKFTARYNETAHCILADAGFAPKLHFCGRVVGGLYLVIMDRVDGKSLWQLQTDKTPIPSGILKNVCDALDLLHQKDIVFGDLRENNILYDASNSRSFVVDFDWPGTEGKSRYPATLNIANQWAEDVLPYSIMFKAHDLWQLKRLGNLCGQDA